VEPHFAAAVAQVPRQSCGPLGVANLNYDDAPAEGTLTVRIDHTADCKSFSYANTCKIEQVNLVEKESPRKGRAEGRTRSAVHFRELVVKQRKNLGRFLVDPGGPVGPTGPRAPRARRASEVGPRDGATLRSATRP
jgi:hypothetical protein